MLGKAKERISSSRASHMRIDAGQGCASEQRYCALQDVLKLLLKNTLGHVEALLGRNEVAYVPGSARERVNRCVNVKA